MPNYSTTRIDAKVMEPRLAKIIETICENYQQYMNLCVLSVIQSSQVEGLSYGRVKKIKLDRVSKQGNEIIICLNTTLGPNNLYFKKSKIIFRFVEGVNDISANDFFSNICRYLKHKNI